MPGKSRALLLASWLESELPADGDGLSCANVVAELRRLYVANTEMQATLNEADRRAGAAERKLASERDTAQRRASWLRTAKAAAGYHDNTSFDVVWTEALAALLASRKK